jgi:hypothetical protein
MAIVKLDETEYWTSPLLAGVRVFGVYVFNRRNHHHLCSLEANYELNLLGYQWDCEDYDSLTDEQREALDELMREGLRDSEQFSYRAVKDMDRVLETEIKQGWFPPEGKSGGFKVEVSAVVHADAIEELTELYHTASV